MMNMNQTNEVTKQVIAGLQTLTARQTADILHMSDKTLYNLTKAGKIVAIREGRMVRYDPRDVEAYKESRKTRKAP